MSKIQKFMSENAMVKDLSTALQEVDVFYFELYSGEDVLIFSDYHYVYEWRFHYGRLCDMKCTWITSSQAQQELEEHICQCMLNCAYAEKETIYVE